MGEAQRISVVILYTHPLLGEGLAHVLAAEPGLEVASVATGDVGAAESALVTRPDVLIVERPGSHEAVDLLKLAPNAILIDVGVDSGRTFTYRREEIGDQPEGIVREIMGIRARVLGALVG